MRIILTILFGAVLSLTWTLNACANVKQLKVYRKVFPDYKPQCIYCHTDEKPKKEDGKHDLNAYGLMLQELMGTEALTEEMLNEAGSHEEFEAQKKTQEDEVEVTEEEATEEGEVSEATEEKAAPKGSKKGSMKGSAKGSME